MLVVFLKEFFEKVNFEKVSKVLFRFANIEGLDQTSPKGLPEHFYQKICVPNSRTLTRVFDKYFGCRLKFYQLRRRNSNENAKKMSLVDKIKENYF